MSTDNQSVFFLCCHPYVQCPKPFSEVRADSTLNSGGGPKEDSRQWDEYNTRYPERSMGLAGQPSGCLSPLTKEQFPEILVH